MDPEKSPIQPEPVQQPEPISAEPIKSQNSFWRAFSIGVGIISIGTAIAIIGFILSGKH